MTPPVGDLFNAAMSLSKAKSTLIVALLNSVTVLSTIQSRKPHERI